MTGTPLQNELNDLYSLIKFLRIAPWNNEKFWKHCIHLPIQSGNENAILCLQNLMEVISIRRLKSTILHLPQKIQHGIGVKLIKPWDEEYENRFSNFTAMFGKNRDQGLGWDSATFFQNLSDLRQLCNHPGLVEKGDTRKYHWKDGAKVVHLITHLKQFLQGQRSVETPRAVVFSEYQRFLEMSVIFQNNLNIINVKT